jgi:N6-adenosine-specific RNA methylase IME4
MFDHERANALMGWSSEIKEGSKVVSSIGPYLTLKSRYFVFKIKGNLFFNSQKTGFSCSSQNYLLIHFHGAPVQRTDSRKPIRIHE